MRRMPPGLGVGSAAAADTADISVTPSRAASPHPMSLDRISSLPWRQPHAGAALLNVRPHASCYDFPDQPCLPIARRRRTMVPAHERAGTNVAGSIVGETAARIFADLADPQKINRATDDAWSAKLWQ